MISAFTFLKSNAHDPISSHIFQSNSFVNPAFSGLHSSFDAVFNYRNQWPGLGNTFNTYKFGMEGFTFSNNMGIGLIASRDVTGGGAFSTTGFDLFYTYTINITPFSKIAFGLQSSIYQYTVNDKGITEIPNWAGSYYQDMPNSNNSVYYPDFASGIAYSSYNFKCALGINHIFEPMKLLNNSGYSLKRRFNFISTYEISMNSRFSKEQRYITPMIYIEIQDNARLLTYGSTYKSEIIEPGIWIRHELFSLKSSTIILSSKINFINLYIVYSFDINLMNSYLTLIKFGIHEVTLGYHIKYKEKRKNYRGTINCPYD